MAITLYNTLTRSKEPLVPMEEGRVKMFVCGPTVYDFPHLGHAKTYTQFDFICRYLRARGLDVFYLQNITDIDDKIISRAAERGITPAQLAKQFEDIYYEDMRSLHNSAVSEYARASEYIAQIVKQVQKLIRKGCAYKISDGYYFDLKQFPEYGKLSGRTALQENDAISRIDDNTEKRNKGDFCLWKFHKEGEPFWETELGKGRPGWHIEDTAITEHFFGPQYDLHGGAVDLIFPHHEAEITQMEAASGKKPFVKYWLHTAFLNINAEKMSKSKGNFKTIRDIFKEYDYSILRFFLISQHYRTPIDFSQDSLEGAKNGLQRVNEFIFNAKSGLDDHLHEKAIHECQKTMFEQLDNDFDTPSAIATLFEFIKDVNTRGGAGRRVVAFMRELNTLLDCFSFEFGSIDESVEDLIAAREEARKAKDFKKADSIRDTLKAKGIELFDTKDGVRWKKA